MDTDLGLMNMRARQYKSDTGRFVTADPRELVGIASEKDAIGIQAGRFSKLVSGRALVELLSAARPTSPRLLAVAGQHRYGYANFDPVRMSDPDGRAAADEDAILYEDKSAEIESERIVAQKVRKEFVCEVKLDEDIEICYSAAPVSEFDYCLQWAGTIT
jgi:hypothetical protein